jgi:nitroreductase
MLKPILAEDIRGLTGQQPYVGEAALNLIYVADFSKMDKKTDEERILLSGADTGFVSQNVYLFCASEGLGTVVRGLIDRRTLTEKMGLRPEQRITLAQSVGYPKD